MPHTTLLTNTVLACLVCGFGCGDRPADVQEPRRVNDRSTTIVVPGKRPWTPVIPKRSPETAPPSMPLWSAPPVRRVREAPKPAPAPAKRTAPAHHQYRDRCGRPLLV